MNDGAANGAERTDQAVVRDRVGRTTVSISHHERCFALALAAIPTHVTTSRREFGHWLRTVAPTPLRADDILLAVSEAVTNAIEHGSGCDAGKRVSIRASIRNEALSVTVRDFGRWIPASQNLASRIHRGRGLILINEFADKVDIVRTGNGTRITMQFDNFRRQNQPSLMSPSGSNLQALHAI
jgi:anti-sigma regulatory factor (Ser/Thr protein kinase)